MVASSYGDSAGYSTNEEADSTSFSWIHFYVRSLPDVSHAKMTYSARVRISRISSGVSSIGLPFMLLATEAFSISAGKSSGVTP